MHGYVEQVLVARLRKAYWPRWCADMTLAKVRRTPPITTHDYPRYPKYDLGRVHFFMHELAAGRTIEPILIDQEVVGHHLGPPTWLGPIIDDSHHRFVASVLLRRRRIPASIGGLVSLADWLTGKRRNYPKECS